jgi:hypothetical protein
MDITEIPVTVALDQNASAADGGCWHSSRADSMTPGAECATDVLKSGASEPLKGS